MELLRYYESRRKRRWLTLAVSAVIAGVTAFAVYDGITSKPAASAVEEGNGAATVKVGKGGLKTVVLIPSAAKRLGIKTARVSSVLVGGSERAVIPYTAVLYDTNGDTWTYTSPKPLTYVRHDVRVDEIDGNRAVLSKGPLPGAAVVTVGSAELWGVEYGEIEED